MTKLPYILSVLLLLGLTTFAKKYDNGVEIIVDQYQGPIDQSDVDQKILRVALTVGNGGGTPSCDGMSFTLSGFSELLNAHLYYTAQDPTFTSPTLLNTQTPSGTVNFTFTGPAELVNGQYYYWLVVDATPTMASGIIIDAEYLGGTYLGGSQNLFPTTPNPAGFRKTGRNYSVGTTEDYITVEEIANSLPSFDYDGTDSIFFELTSNYANPTENPIIFQNYKGIAPTVIRPEISQTSKVTGGTPAASVDFITFDGCENVIFDGRPGGSGSNREWSIQNQGSASPKGSAMVFQNDASYNAFQYVIVQADANTFQSEVISLRVTSGSTGNDNNRFNNCLIKEYLGGTDRPRNGIFSAGTAGMENSGNIIENCEFVDIWNPTAAGGSIFLNGSNDNWTITNNHFYQTSPLASCDNVYAFIQILSGGDYTIDGNFMGGQAINCGGTAFSVTSGTSALQGIRLNTSSGTNTIINNTFANINYTSGCTSAFYPLQFLYLNGASDATIDRNTIGATTGINNLILTHNGTNSKGFSGIEMTGTGTISILNNTFGAITQNGTRDLAIMKLIDCINGTTTLTSNTFGNTTANNLLMSSNSGFYFISNTSSSGITILNNTFQNLDYNATTAYMYGVNNASGTLNMEGNTITNINSASDGLLCTIYNNSSAGVAVNNNSISDITLSSTGTVGSFIGIKNNASGNMTASNNFIGGSGANNISIAANSLNLGITNQGGGTATVSGNIIQNWNMTSTGASVLFRGMSNTGSGSVLKATDNIITNIHSVGTPSGYLLVGLYINPSGSPTGIEIIGNEISNLFADNAGASSSHVIGLDVNGSDGIIRDNLIYGLEDKSGTGTPIISGINMTSGTWSAINNVVIIDNGANTNDISVFGMYDFESTNTITAYHNTVVIGGSMIGSSASTAYYKELSGPLNLKNNILQNNRTGGSGGHFAIYSNNAWSGTNDYNYLEVIENTTNLAYNNVGAEDLATWKSNTGASNSFSGTISIDAGGYSSGVIQSAGTDLVTGGEVLLDKDGVTRSTTPWLGAYEGPVKDKDSQLNIGAGSEPSTISSLIDSDGEEILVLDFDFQDMGTSDGLATIIDSLFIYSSLDNEVPDWVDAIAGAKLYGPDLTGGLIGTIHKDYIEFGGTSYIITITDATTENYELRIYLKTDLSVVNDNDMLGFQISFDDIVTQPTNSSFGGGFVETGAGKVAIDIVATSLIFGTDEPPVTAYINQDFISSVQAVDVNGNIDVDATDLVELTLNTGGGIFSVPLGQVNLINGEYTWQGNYDTAENIDLIVTCATLGNTLSGNIDVQSSTVFDVGNGGFSTIQAAYDAIPTTLVDNYIIELYEDYDPTNESYPLIGFGIKTGHGPNNNIILRPALGQAGIVIEGDPGLNEMWQIDGADYITIDGRPGGIGEEKELLIRNTHTASPANAAAAIRILNEATNNIIKYVIFEGEVGDAGMLLQISDGGVGDGSDYNTIDNCVFRDLSVGGTSETPSSAIWINAGIGTSVANVISNCEFVDFYNQDGGGANGTNVIVLSTNAVSTTVSDNHFYQSSSIANHNVPNFSFININGSVNSVIVGNYFGGTEKYGGGAPFSIDAGTEVIYGIYDFNGDAIIEDNYIGNLTYSTSNSVAGEYPFIGIQTVGSSNTNVGNINKGNTIANVSITNNGSGSNNFCGVFNSGSGNVSVIDNTITNVVSNGSSTGKSALIDNASGSTIIDNNIFSEVVISNDGQFYVVDNNSTLGITVTNNTIQNIDHQGLSGGASMRVIQTLDGPTLMTDNYFSNITSSADADNRIISDLGTGPNLIDGNYFESLSSTGIGASDLSVIYVNSSGNISVTNNTIGSETSNNISVAGTLDSYGIYSYGSGTATINNNIIRNIENTAASTKWYGIYNNIGDLICDNNFLYSWRHDSNDWLGAIANNGGASTITNNTIQQMDLNNTGSSTVFYGVYLNSTSAQTVSNNTIGNAFTNNITTIANAEMFGVFSDGSGGSTINGNTIQQFHGTGSGNIGAFKGIYTVLGAANIYDNIITNFDNLTNGNAMYGIDASAVGATNAVYNNEITNLHADYTGGTVTLHRGISLNGSSGTGECYNNYVSGLRLKNTNVNDELRGIEVNNGSWTVYNNVIVCDNEGETNGVQIDGIWYVSSGNGSVYHNTVKLGGVTTGNFMSRALFSNTGAVLDVKNNVLQNLRTGGTLQHSAIYHNNTLSVTSDFNYLEVDPTMASNIGNWNGTFYNFTDWKTNATATNDLNSTELIDNDGYFTGNFVAGKGTNLTGTVPLDKDGATRSITPWMGAYESGVSSYLYWFQDAGDWNNNAKWFYASNGNTPCNCLPAASHNIIFDANSFTGSDQIITFPSGTYTIKSIDFQGGFTPTITGEGIMVITP